MGVKREISLTLAHRLVNHGATILVTSQHEGRRNILTIAWQMPASHQPPLLAICVCTTHYSYELIHKSKEFVINVPPVEILDKLHYCGTVSGRERNKFKETGLTPIPAKRVKAPLIKECIGHIECRVEKEIVSGDHTIFIGQPLVAIVDPSLFDGTWNVDRAKTIHHLGGAKYTIPHKRVEVKKGVGGKGEVF